MRRNTHSWSRGEKSLFLAPAIFIIGAVVAFVAPKMTSRYLGEPDHVLPTNNGVQLRHLVLSGDGHVLAASGTTYYNSKGRQMPLCSPVLLWDAHTLKPLPAVPPVKAPGSMIGYPTGLAISPDAKLLSMDGVGSLLRVHNRDSQRDLWKKSIVEKDSERLAFSPSGQEIAVHNRDSTQILDPETGKVLASWNTKFKPYQGATSIAWSPDGKNVAVINAFIPATDVNGFYTNGEQVELRDARTGRLIRTFEGICTRSVRFSPSGKYLLTTALSGTFPVNDPPFWDGLRCYEVATGKIVWKYEAWGSDADFIDVAYAPDERTVASYRSRGGKIYILNALTGKSVKTLSSGKNFQESNYLSSSALAYSSDGKCLFARSKTSVLVWDLTR